MQVRWDIYKELLTLDAIIGRSESSDIRDMTGICWWKLIVIDETGLLLAVPGVRKINSYSVLQSNNSVI